MSVNRPQTASVIIIMASLLALAGYAALWILAEPAPRPAGAAARPSSLPAAEAMIRDLIERHNARQGRIRLVNLKGQCTWHLDMPGEPRPMTIAYELPSRRGKMTCGPDSCEIDGEKVIASQGSAMTVDALYLLMFQTFASKDFTPGSGGESAQRTLVGKSDARTLEFDERTGLLVGGTIRMPKGTVAFSFSEYKELPGQSGVPVPTTVTIVVPAEMFPFERTRGGSITLRIDAGTSEVRGAP